MADKKKGNSGLSAPAIGTIHPKGSTIRRNPNGTITIVEPKKGTKKKGK